MHPKYSDPRSSPTFQCKFHFILVQQTPSAIEMGEKTELVFLGRCVMRTEEAAVIQH